MIAPLIMAQAVVQSLAPGIPQPVPPTRFSCDLAAADGTRFTLAGTTPEFPKGWDPNRMKYVTMDSSHEAFQGKVGVDPSDASEWFRDFQVSTSGKGGVLYTLQLKLRRGGTSVAYGTRYQSTGEQAPFDYHAAGLCRAEFAPAAGRQEKGQ